MRKSSVLGAACSVVFLLGTVTTPASASDIQPNECTGGCYGDLNGDGKTTIDEILKAVNTALGECDCQDLTGTWQGNSGTDQNPMQHGWSIAITQKGCIISGVLSHISGPGAGSAYSIKGSVTGSAVVFDLEVYGFTSCYQSNSECTQRWRGTVAPDGQSMGGREDTPACGDLFPWSLTRK